MSHKRHDERPSFLLTFKQRCRTDVMGGSDIDAELWVLGMYGNAHDVTMEAKPISSRSLRRCGSPRRAVEQAVKAAEATIKAAACWRQMKVTNAAVTRGFQKREQKAQDALRLCRELLAFEGRIDYCEDFERRIVDQTEGIEARMYINPPVKKGGAKC